MRKLTYIGTKMAMNGNVEVEVTSYEEKKELEKMGFKFTERLDEITETETEKQKEKRLARVAKRMNAIKKKA